MIRIAERRDIPAMTEIYNEQVRNGTATFDLEECSVENRTAWFEAHTGKYVLLVYEREGVVAGYASLSQYRVKAAYDSTVELSVYVGAAFRGQGIGRALMEALLARARADERLHTVVSVITEGNAASCRLHESLGLTHCGTVREAGRKFGRWIGIETYQIMV
ncbi:MAG: N-acetyltransferase [Butyricicoccus sp.]|nr:N-acetyltransferase [Butyricicoccus sp.]